jgi:acyl-coenzyme A thioesterase PaaI-like protein
MKETNDYGMYSGAFIFDALDRAALDYVRKESGLNTTIVTKHAQIDFLRQLCDDNYRVECSEYQQVFKSFYCQAWVRDKDGFPVAHGLFQFVEATNHCEPERKEKGNATGNNDNPGFA